MGDVVPGVLRELGLGGAAVAARIGEAWAELVGAEAAAHSWPSGLRAGVLEVEVDASVWAQQLQLRRSTLLAELARRLEGVAEAPRDLRLRVGRGAPTGRPGPRGPGL